MNNIFKYINNESNSINEITEEELNSLHFPVEVCNVIGKDFNPAVAKHFLASYRNPITYNQYIKEIIQSLIIEFNFDSEGVQFILEELYKASRPNATSESILFAKNCGINQSYYFHINLEVPINLNASNKLLNICMNVRTLGLVQESIKLSCDVVAELIEYYQSRGVLNKYLNNSFK